ncbi:EF hand [mine drainage metagenome]|uniref:EF hand n=1 Tax=mine drainage metagenome TaxID=410659 RepID=A0A1J5U262_9ZZZZ
MMMSGTKRPDPSKIVDDLFSKLDTTGKGYLTKSDLQSALTQLPGSDSSNRTGSTSNSANVDELFKKLDANGDGKITKGELTSGLKQLADAFGSQNVSSGGGNAGAPAAGGTPPSDPGNANSTSSTNGTSSTQSSSTSKTYDPADTNQDGTVSAQERIAYALKQLTSQLHSSASSMSSNSTSSTSTSSDAKIFKQFTDIMHAYGSSSIGSNNSNYGLSVTA